MGHWITEEDGEKVWGLTDAEESALHEEMEPHAGKWVAIHTREDGSETVAGVGVDAVEAKADAWSKGYAEVCLMYAGHPAGGSALMPKHSAAALNPRRP